MSPVVNVNNVDRAFYASHLESFLPERIVDIHTHVWRQRDRAATRPTQKPRAVTWPARVAAENPIEDLLESYALMLPGKRVTPLIFATVPGDGDLEPMNRYVADSAETYSLPALLFTDPAWSAEELERRLLADGFKGAKSYLTLAPDYLPGDQIRVFDFFPLHHLDVLNRHGMVVMLHIPRPQRLRDPVNLAQMLEIDRTFPRIGLVVAHVGRAYCDHDMGNAFEVLAKSKRLRFDISANTNDTVFEQALRSVGPQRILFGSDMPILRMRMRRITRDGHYVNLVPKGLYGDVSGDTNMAEVEGGEAEQLTFFLYEEIAAFRRAAERLGLSQEDVRDVFAGNAQRLLSLPD